LAGYSRETTIRLAPAQPPVPLYPLAETTTQEITTVGHFNREQLANLDAHTTDDDYYDRREGARTMTTTPRKGSVPLAALPPISQADANAEQEADRLFPEPRAYPKNRAAIQAIYDGFIVTFEVTDAKIGQVEQLIGTLIERGYTPAALPVAPAQGQNGNGHAPATDQPPSCRIHNRPMKRMNWASKEGHTWHCTAKMGDDWCAERA
jgi:hypothetical protein